MYRLREYSRRASYSIAINGDETVNFYQQIPQLTAIFHNQESGYFVNYVIGIFLQKRMKEHL